MDSVNKLVDVFDPRRNALNSLRLGLSVGVIVYHSFPLTGTRIGFEPLRQLLGSLSVDAFFAVSGYLILSSWMRRPQWWPYLRARILRIMPGFYVSALITAFGIAPLAIVVGGNRLPAGFFGAAVTYVSSNALLRVHEYAIVGTPFGIPYPHVWNGSIWTLWWEFLCYLGVMFLGLLRLLRWRPVIVGFFALTFLAFIGSAYAHIHFPYLDDGSRFGLMFASGSMVYAFRDRLPASWSLVGLAGAIVVASAWLPDYRLLAALPIAYVAIVTGALIKDARLRPTNDISYGTYIYAFPMQQLLASAGLYKAGVAVFAIVSIAVTLPLAASSWFLVEKQALKLKGAGRTRSTRADTSEPGDGPMRAGSPLAPEQHDRTDAST